MGADEKLTAAIKGLAGQCGFDLVGIAPAGALPAAEALNEWLGRKWHARMAYMARNVEKRRAPNVLVPGAKSVICLAVSYGPGPGLPADAVSVARYARGRDYHKVLKRRCHELMDRIGALCPPFEGRAFVDTAPVMERALARRAALGVIGLNGCLITERFGSYVLLCEIVCNLRLRAERSVEGHCSRCGACRAACPTGALGDDAMVDARKCISYLTIEHRGEIDAAQWPTMGQALFGCDRCQSVCPHNQDLPPGDAELCPDGQVLDGADLSAILNWQADDWDRATAGSPMRRATYEMFLRNALIAAGNGARARDSDGAALVRAIEALGRRDAHFQPLCRWALGQLNA